MILKDSRLQTNISQEPYHEWIMATQEKWALFYRFESEYLIRFPDLADFTLSKDGLHVIVYPVPGFTTQTIEHLYLNVVASLALSCQLKPVLHGSAVQIGGSAIAFLATSGGGKSTLAASFATSGYEFLTDDCLLLENVNSHYFVQPSHPSIRLWDDSRVEIIPDTTCSSPSIDYTPKARLLADGKVTFYDKELPLRNIYFLGEGITEIVSITAVTGYEVIIELEKHSFLLDMDDRKMLAHHFQQITALAQHQNFFRLDYPRNYEILAHVRKSLVNHVNKKYF